jgi:hypothetical protein
MFLMFIFLSCNVPYVFVDGGAPNNQRGLAAWAARGCKLHMQLL